MKQRLFQFAVIFHEKNSKDEIKSKEIIPIKTIMAVDDKVALLQIAKQIPDKFQEKLQDIEILIRPF